MGKKIFVVGRSNLACTVFVPFDCANNCPFCTSKEMYKDKKFDLSLDGVINSVRKINKNNDITEFVMTGGEPFAKLESLARIIEECQKPVYINTTLPLYRGDIDKVINFINSNDKIKGINVSRHIGMDFKGVASIDFIDEIEKPVRINTVIPQYDTYEELADSIRGFVRYWGSDKRIINLRANYKNIDFHNLKNLDDVERTLAGIYTHKGGGGCMVCNTTHFEAENCQVNYHRGRMMSSVTIGDKVYINDIIMAMDGTIYQDWDMQNDDEFNDWVFKKDDINPTYLQCLIDWKDSKLIKTYYVTGLVQDDVHLGDLSERPLTFTNNEEKEKVKDILHKKFGDFIVNIMEVTKVYEKKPERKEFYF